jgi:transcriptional regulator GlxA family with amidase domain
MSFVESVWTWVAANVAAWGLAACGNGAAPLPPAPTDAALIERQAQAFVDAMKPRRAGRPVVAVLARNEGTEVTDFLLPHAVLQRSGVAQVHAVAPRRGAVQLYPALQVEVNEDLAGFDRTHPQGADYVIVPAMEVEDDPVIAAWLRKQAASGARIVGVCNGTLALGRAGLLDGRQVAGHWYSRQTVRERHPSTTHVPHQRYVADRGIATTTGITASVPTMLALVEAIGGRDTARALADELGVASWSPAHDSARFVLTAGRAANFLLNKAVFWGHQRFSVPVRDGSDDIAIALAADAWSRTGRIEVDATSSDGSVRLRSGITLVTAPPAPHAVQLPLQPGLKPLQQLDRTLCEIGERYGDARLEWVMLEMEYPGRPACPA